MKKNKISEKDKKHILNLRKKAILGIIDILILNWIKKQPICGQDIMERILKEWNIYVGPGTLYPILYNLQNKSLIESKLYNKKRMYFLTKKGKTISIKAKKDYFKIQKAVLKFLKS